MKIADLVMILAVFAGPIVAVQLSRYLDRKKEIHERKLVIFKTLMATRATTLSAPRGSVEPDRPGVGADNKREREVITAGKPMDLLGDAADSA